MPNVSYLYSNIRSKDILVVFFNQDTGSWYADRKREKTGEVTVMVPPGIPSGTYTLQLIDTVTGRKITNNTESFVIEEGAKPTARINTESLRATTRNPIVSGTAQNLYDVAISVEDENFQKYFSSEADVSPENGGVWSIELTDANLPNGTYTVKIFNSRDQSMEVLAEGELVVQLK